MVYVLLFAESQVPDISLLTYNTSTSFRLWLQHISPNQA